MDLTWLDPDHLDGRDTAAAVALLEAARQVDRPWSAGTTLTPFVAMLRHGYDGDPPAVALARDPDGRAVGLLEVWSPRWDNGHLASVEVTVDPLARRRGLGRALFDIGVERVRAQGRTLLLSFCVEGTAGVEFLKRMGLEPALDEVLRRLDVTTVDYARLDSDAATAAPHATGYDFVRLPTPSPEKMLSDLAAMTAAINDAPTGKLEIEDEVFTPARIQAYEQAQLAAGRRFYRVAARHRGSGELAGQTVALVDGERPWWCFQHDTSVLRTHRGHRLGLLLKIEMLRWLREREPQVRFMDTGNAADNAHMIAVNEALGYRVVVRAIEWQRRLTHPVTHPADVAAAASR